MYAYMVEDCRRALAALAPPKREEFAAAWRKTVANQPSQGARRLVPFVGSGLNRLAQGGVSDWRKLVEGVEKVVPVKWSRHEDTVANLLFPEKLELLLAEAIASQESNVRAEETG